MYPILLFGILFIVGCTNAQYGAQTAVNVSFNFYASTPTWFWSLVHLPADYASTSTSYPLVVFFHGAGQVTNTRSSGDLASIANTWGPCAEVRKGSNLEFTVASVVYKFIAVCPQFWTNFQPYPGAGAKWDQFGYAQNSFIDKIVSLYRVDTTRIYLTGLSDGGYSSLGSAVNSISQASRFAALGLVDFTSQDNYATPGMCNLAASVPLWVSCGNADGFYTANAQYVTLYNNCSPRTYTATMHSVAGGVHDGTSFDPAYATNHSWNNPNIYEWFLMQKRGSNPPATPAPTPPPTVTPSPTPTPPGCPAPRIGSGTGIKGAYYAAAQSFTNLKGVRVDSNINFNWGSGGPFDGPFPVDDFTVRWNASLLAKQSGVHTFYGDSDDGIRIYVNNNLLVDQWVVRAETESTGTISLVAGQTYPFVVEYFEHTLGAVAKVSWSAPCLTKEVIPQSQLTYAAFNVC